MEWNVEEDEEEEEERKKERVHLHILVGYIPKKNDAQGMEWRRRRGRRRRKIKEFTHTYLYQTQTYLTNVLLPASQSPTTATQGPTVAKSIESHALVSICSIVCFFYERLCVCCCLLVDSWFFLTIPDASFHK